MRNCFNNVINLSVFASWRKNNFTQRRKGAKKASYLQCKFHFEKSAAQIFFSVFLISTFHTTAQTVTGEPAGIPPVSEIYKANPWEDPLICGINRDPARATAYSYQIA